MFQNKQHGLSSLGLGRHSSARHFLFLIGRGICVYRTQIRVSTPGSTGRLAVGLNSKEIVFVVVVFYLGMFSKLKKNP